MPFCFLEEEVEMTEVAEETPKKKKKKEKKAAAEETIEEEVPVAEVSS